MRDARRPATYTATMHIAIRPATEADLPAMRPLLDQLGYPVEAEALRARFRAYVDNRGLTLLAHSDERVVGVAFASARYDLLAPPLAELQGLVVASQARSGGIGAKLLTAVEAWALESGLSGVTLGTRVERVRAHKFYEVNGYTLAKQWHVYRKYLGHSETEA